MVRARDLPCGELLAGRLAAARLLLEKSIVPGKINQITNLYRTSNENNNTQVRIRVVVGIGAGR